MLGMAKMAVTHKVFNVIKNMAKLDSDRQDGCAYQLIINLFGGKERKRKVR